MTAPASERTEFPLHGGAKAAYTVVGVLLCLLIITIPVGIYIIVRGRSGFVRLSGDAILARAIGSKRISLTDAQRVGVCRVPIIAKGIGGYLAKRKCGGEEGVNLCVMDGRGKTRKFIASMYVDHPQIIDHATRTTGRLLEEVRLGAFGLKWPEAR
jgi:hypothetical protein